MSKKIQSSLREIELAKPAASLSLENPPHILITRHSLLVMNLATSPPLLLQPILPLQAPPQRPSNNQISNQIPQRKPMPQMEPWTRLRPIKLRAQYRAAVPNRDRHRCSRRSLRLSTDVRRRPAQYDGATGVDTGCGENCAEV